MKKLVIVITAVLLGNIANAASFRWTAAKLYTADGSSTVPEGTVATLWGSSTKDASGYINYAAITTATASPTGGISKVFEIEDAAEKYSFYFTYESAGKEFSSLVANKTKEVLSSETGDTPISFGTMATVSRSAANWKNIPEPTSGLLLILGVAGLALKRKRA